MNTTIERKAIVGTEAVDRLARLAKKAKILAVGDCVLDVYWEMAAEQTPVAAIERQRFEVGAICNIAQNFKALGFDAIQLCSVVGDDLWGRELTRELQDSIGAQEGIMVQSEEWATPVHLRRCRNDEPVDRQDFGLKNRVSKGTQDRFIQSIERALPQANLVVVYQKFSNGVLSSEVLSQIQKMALANPDVPFVFSLKTAEFTKLQGCFLKADACTAVEIAGIDKEADGPVTYNQTVLAGNKLFSLSGKPVIISLGARGALLFDERGSTEVPSVQVIGRTDCMGSGDALLTGFCAGLIGGLSPEESLYIGVFSSSVSVRTLNSAGSPSIEELRQAVDEHALIYHPGLAEDSRLARILEHTEFELVESCLPDRPIEYAIFDHDGTISTLRQGWENVMEPVMMHCILGDAYASVDEAIFRKVKGRVLEFIDQTTGIQTLLQMKGLVSMVREFGFVPEEQVLDEFGYKKIYNDGLMEMVRGRVDKLTRGELDVADFTVKNAVPFLKALRAAGVRLYLASGTDEEDVIQEAKVLGYADLFNGGIFGATRDVTHEAKRAVLIRILNEIGPQQAGRLVTMGDGPVEMRETRKRGGFAVGLASDEIQRFGWNHLKRSRLIRAGAHLIVPDFSQKDALLNILMAKK